MERKRKKEKLTEFSAMSLFPLTKRELQKCKQKVASYLYLRILKRGEDSRFRRIRDKPRRFIIFWQIQAVWVSLMLIPVFMANSIPASTLEAGLPAWTKATDVVGIALWLFGFVFESTADYQKSKWLGEKMAKIHDEQFITRGLFSRR